MKSFQPKLDSFPHLASVTSDCNIDSHKRTVSHLNQRVFRILRFYFAQFDVLHNPFSLLRSGWKQKYWDYLWKLWCLTLNLLQAVNQLKIYMTLGTRPALIWSFSQTTSIHTWYAGEYLQHRVQNYTTYVSINPSLASETQKLREPVIYKCSGDCFTLSQRFLVFYSSFSKTLHNVFKNLLFLSSTLQVIVTLMPLVKTNLCYCSLSLINWHHCRYSEGKSNAILKSPCLQNFQINCCPWRTPCLLKRGSGQFCSVLDLS